jgi:hypothetical protein
MFNPVRLCNYPCNNTYFYRVRELSVFFKQGDGQWRKKKSVLGAAMLAVTNAFQIDGQG